TGAPVSSLLPARPSETCPPSTGPADTSGPPSGSPAADSLTAACSPTAVSPGPLAGPHDPSALRVTGRVNLTLPLATRLGQSDTPGHAAGYGPLDAADPRTLANALAAHPSTRWCLTLTGPDGRPIAHGCAHSRPTTAPRDGPATKTSPRPTTGTGDGPA